MIKCINAEQFIALKKGDKFFYSKPKSQDGFFSEDQVKEIEKTGLSKVICTMMKDRENDDNIIDSTGETRKDPFDLNSGKIRCEELGGYDFEAWREACEYFRIYQISHWKDQNFEHKK